ncbi:SCAN domain-containing protein 3 isoform X2 [Ictalurus punctatus]|nr:SCAN domain-containing protein 3 isoform X2 [Ictalurus punctatus]
MGSTNSTEMIKILIQARAATQQKLQSNMQQPESILQWSEQHRQRFRSLTLREVGDQFAFVQQLQDLCQKWLLAEDCDPARIVQRVVMEQFINQLPEETAHWVQNHQPATLNEAIHLAKIHLTAFILSTSLPEYDSTMNSTEMITIPHVEQWQRQYLEALIKGQAEIQWMLQSFMHQLECKDSKTAVSQQSEQYRLRFRSVTVGEIGDLFVFAQQLQDLGQKWLLAEDCDPARIVQRVVFEQFINRLPEETAHWVQHHQPATLNEAIQLSKNHPLSLTTTIKRSNFI